MKQKIFCGARLLVFLLGFGLVSVTHAQTGEVVVPEADRSCDKAVDEMAMALRKTPKSLLIELTNRVGAAPWCACPLTKTAIQTIDASGDLVGEIVYAATTAAPEQFKVIATCALEVAPDAAEEIRQALLKAFGETSDEYVASGKGKSVAVEVPVEGILVEPPTATPALSARPGGFIDNIFVIPPAGFTPPTKEPPSEDPPMSPPPKGTDSNPGS